MENFFAIEIVRGRFFIRYTLTLKLLPQLMMAVRTENVEFLNISCSMRKFAYCWHHDWKDNLASCCMRKLSPHTPPPACPANGPTPCLPPQKMTMNDAEAMTSQEATLAGPGSGSPYIRQLKNRTAQASFTLFSWRISVMEPPGSARPVGLRRVFKDYFSRHSNLSRHENRF